MGLLRRLHPEIDSESLAGNRALLRVRTGHQEALGSSTLCLDVRGSAQEEDSWRYVDRTERAIITSQQAGASYRNPSIAEE